RPVRIASRARTFKFPDSRASAAQKSRVLVLYCVDAAEIAPQNVRGSAKCLYHKGMWSIPDWYISEGAAMHLLKKMVWALFILVLLPSAAFAQATLAGVAKDASGAVLPGVTVEASSEALIEKTRTAITDGTGQYQIVDLRPGTYVVTFTLTGFSTIKREGVTVTGVGTITVNADMKVGNVSETVNVSGEAPIVDVQSSKRQAVIDSGTLRDLPSARSPANLLASIPALTGSAVNVSSATPTFVAFFSAHGGPANEGNIQIDSLPAGAASNGGGTSGAAYDTFNAQELQITVSGSLGEAETGGPILNILPKTGGNKFKG